MMSMLDYLATAQRWREQWGYTGHGGAVVLHDGKVQSWGASCTALIIGNLAASKLMRTAKDG